jgi:uncharacterized membrane protein YcaP (DUF421 family)
MDIVVRAAIMFLFLFSLLRLMGKRELGNMAPFDLILMVVMGDLVQQAITQSDTSVTGAVLAVGTFALLALLISWVTFRFPASQRFLEGKPLVLAINGQICEENLARDRLTIDEIFAEMRLAGVADLRDVKCAILETNGKISFITHNAARDVIEPNRS